MKDKLAIVTASIGDEANRMLEISRPFFEQYAKKVNADFIVISQFKVRYHSPHLEKFQLYDILGNYDRVIFFDSDIIIQNITPNLFRIVPKTHVGAVYDCKDNNPNNTNRNNEILNSQRTLGYIEWLRGYINSGVLVLSSFHKEIFTDPQDRFKFKSGYKDQTLINYNIRKFDFPVYKLDVVYNGMEINGFSSRKQNPHYEYTGNKLDAFIMHFANETPKLDQMKLCVHLIEEKNFDSASGESQLSRPKSNELSNHIPKRQNQQKPVIEEILEEHDPTDEVQQEPDIIEEEVPEIDDIPLEITSDLEIEVQEEQSQDEEIPNELDQRDEVDWDNVQKIVGKIANPNELKVFYDISELGWAMYLAAHLKYLHSKGVRVGIIARRSREVLYRNATEVILPFPPQYFEAFGNLPSDGNHLYDPDSQERIKDHTLLSQPFKDAYPTLNIITSYNRFENERTFEPYSHSAEAEEICNQIFGKSKVIIVFPRCRSSKFKCRNIQRAYWEKIIHSLCSTFPNYNVVSIGSKSGAFDIDMDYVNYINLVKYEDSKTLDIMVALCNTNKAITAIGNQSGTVKITLLCNLPTYIIGHEKKRHTIDENWSRTMVKFWFSAESSNGYKINDFDDMNRDIISFVTEQIEKTKVKKTPFISNNNHMQNGLPSSLVVGRRR